MRYDYTPRKCSALGCTTKVESKILMCRPHWRKVPKTVQHEIWKQYDPFAAKQKLDYFKAVKTAIEIVREKTHEKSNHNP